MKRERLQKKERYHLERKKERKKSGKRKMILQRKKHFMNRER